jgi:hypothetical protein
MTSDSQQLRGLVRARPGIDEAVLLADVVNLTPNGLGSALVAQTTVEVSAVVVDCRRDLVVFDIACAGSSILEQPADSARHGRPAVIAVTRRGDLNAKPAIFDMTPAWRFR